MKKRYLFIFIIFTLFIFSTGCSIKNKETDNTNNSNTTSKEEEKSDNSTSDDDLQMYSDNTKIVFENTNSKFVFYYSGEKITAYHVYVNYESEALAKVALDELKKDNTDNVDKVYTKGKYLVIEYAKSEYEDLTVSAVRIAYSAMKELKK